MDLINRTGFNVGLPYTVVDEDMMLASAIVRASFDIVDGELVASEEQEWPIGEPVELELGAFDEDSPFRKAGVDVMLLGHAYPEKTPGTRSRVELQIGSQSWSVLVYGNRRWMRSGKKLVPDRPQPFQSIPLTWERAYGGKCPVENGDFPFHANPDGRGFYVDEESAEGGVLPNLEDPDNQIATWQDQPEPTCFAPLPRESSLRIFNSAEFDTDTAPPQIRRIKPSYHNNANPKLILPKVPPPDSTVRVTGVQANGRELNFRLPELSFHAYVQLQDRSYVFPSQLDTITILSDEPRVILGHRCCFKYRFRPLERRVAIVREGSAPATVPPEYIVDWAEFNASEVVNV